MGDYYNTTRTLLSVTLRQGGSASIAPKSWCYIPPEEEGTSSLAASVRKGFLVRSTVSSAVTSATPPVEVNPPTVAEVLPLVSAVIATPVPESATPSVSAPEPVVVAPSVTEHKQSRRNR